MTANWAMMVFLALFLLVYLAIAVACFYLAFRGWRQERKMRQQRKEQETVVLSQADVPFRPRPAPGVARTAKAMPKAPAGEPPRQDAPGLSTESGGAADLPHEPGVPAARQAPPPDGPRAGAQLPPNTQPDGPAKPQGKQPSGGHEGKAS